MPVKLQHSAHRTKIYERYGSLVFKELYALKRGDYFLVKEVSKHGTIKCLNHLVDKTRSQYLSDLCTEMQVRGILARNGKTYFFVRKKKTKHE
jgi:hypothetical protein